MRELQFAKAAIATGWHILIEEAGLQPGDIQQVLLAGRYQSAAEAYQALGEQLARVHDPELYLVNSEEFRARQEELEAKRVGTGLASFAIDRDSSSGYARVVTALDGSPAARAGIHPRDLIVSINGEPTREMSHEQILDALGVEAVGKVRLVTRRGWRTRRVVLEPSQRPLDAVQFSHKKIDGKRIGYIRVLLFTPDAGRKVQSAVIELEHAGVDGYVLDLRNNPGGSLAAAESAARAFTAGVLGSEVRGSGRPEPLETRGAPLTGKPVRIAEELGVNIFHTSPTAIRALRRAGPDEPAKYSYHFKHMTTVGEPIEPLVWRWYYETVGKREAAIVDTWWQTENGGFLGSTLPALEPMKPGSCGPGVLGIYPVIYDEEGKTVEAGSGPARNICIRKPGPGSFQTIWGDPDPFVQTHYEKDCRDTTGTHWHDRPYFANDGAVQAADGYFRILGRVDDVINVAGHRLGTKELESATMTVEEIAEAAAVPVIDELRGRAVEMYVSLKPGFSPSKDIEQKVIGAIEEEIGKIARPKNVWIVADMPKTRSGKIMRRVIASISNFTDVGDVTTLANPEIVEDILHHVQTEKVSRGDTPRELTDKEKEEIKAFGQAE